MRPLFAIALLSIACSGSRVVVSIENGGLRIPDDIDEVGRHLFEQGIYVTMAAYPLVPKHEVGFRIQLTSANSDEQVTHLIDVLAQLAERFAFHDPDRPVRLLPRR